MEWVICNRKTDRFLPIYDTLHAVIGTRFNQPDHKHSSYFYELTVLTVGRKRIPHILQNVTRASNFASSLFIIQS